MLKKLIMLLGIFAIENSINCAEAQNAIGINYITKISDADLAQISSANVCGICLQELFTDINNLYKSNCSQMFTHPHIFHGDCILGWIRSRQPLAPSCPVCREQMTNSNITLIEASKNGYLEVVRLLLDRGDDVNVRSNSGSTVLMLASFNGHLEIVRFLIDRGANINAISNLGSAALIYASLNRHLEIVRLLLDEGADINAKNDFGYTALMFASENGYLEIARLLIGIGADINSRNNFGYTALMLAHHGKHQEIADLLIAHGAIK